MTSVVVTGGRGSGGSYLIEYIVSNSTSSELYVPQRWRSSSTPLSPKNNERINYLECDLTDLSSTIRFLQIAQPEYVFHLAAHANVRASFDNPISVFENNARGTHNILEGLRVLDFKPRFLLASTSEVYGNPAPEELPIKENQLLNPVSPYAASKVAQEMLVRSYANSFGLPAIITRMFTYLNPRRTDLFATSFVHQAIQVKRGASKEIRHGNLDSVRTLLDVRDASEAYWVAMQKCRIGEIYNIGGLNSIQVGEFLLTLIEKLGIKPELVQDAQLMRPSDVTQQIPSSQKFRKDTGWCEKFTLVESIDFLIDNISKLS